MIVQAILSIQEHFKFIAMPPEYPCITTNGYNFHVSQKNGPSCRKTGQIKQSLFLQKRKSNRNSP